MLQRSPAGLMALLSTYGYGAVFACLAIERTGIPFPGETMLLVAAIYAGTTHQLSLVLVIAAAASGAILGLYLFRRHGGKVVFFGRFVAVLRIWAALLAGVNRMGTKCSLPWRQQGVRPAGRNCSALPRQSEEASSLH